MALMIEVGTLREVDGRGTGMRTYNAKLLSSVHARMSELGQDEAAQAVLAWLDPAAEPHDEAALQEAAERLQAMEAAASKEGRDKDAMYLEVARFCAEARLA